MALTIEDMKKIIVDMLTGQKRRIDGKEADAFRVAAQKDIDLAKKKVWVIDIPA